MCKIFYAIKGQWLVQVLRFMTFYMPLWGAILFNGTVYFQVIRMLNHATRVQIHSFSCSVFFI
jgi:hypothetical protein